MAKSAGAVEYTDFFSADGQENPNKCSGYDMKQSDGEASVTLDSWGMRSTLLLPSLWSLLWPRVVALVGCYLCVKKIKLRSYAEVNY